jgi:hypothetical protein
MKEIWKYKLDPRVSTIPMPEGAEILSVQVQRETPCVWAEVDPTHPLYVRTFEIYGTGHPINDMSGHERKFIGTFQLNQGDLVFHVFETIKSK